MLQKLLLICLSSLVVNASFAAEWSWDQLSDTEGQTLLLTIPKVQGTTGNETRVNTLVRPKGTAVQPNRSITTQPALIVAGGAAAGLANTFDTGIALTNNVSSIARNGSSTYLATVTNYSSTPSVVGVSWTITGSGGATPTLGAATCQPTTGGGYCLVDSLTPTATLTLGSGNSAVIQIPVTAGNNTGSITASATVVMASAGQVDAAPSNNTATDVDTITASGTDLAITVNDATASRVSGSSAPYTVTVVNSGAVTSQVLLTLSASSTTGSPTSSLACETTTSGSTCNAATRVLLLAGGGSSTLTYTVGYPVVSGVGHSLTVTGTVAVNGVGYVGNVVDTNLANNTASDTNTITAATTDVNVTVTDSIASIYPSTNNIWTATVRNTGSYATNVTVSGTVTGSGGATPGASTRYCGTGHSAGVTCGVSGGNAMLVIPANGTGYVGMSANSGASSGGVLTASMTATITTANLADSNSSNNTATDTTSIAASVTDLSIVATSTPSTLLPQASSVVYPIRITNNGPLSTTGSVAFNITNSGGGNMTAAYVYAGVATGGATVSGTNVTMPSGSTLLFNVTVTNNAAVGSGLLTATVNATGAVTDSNLANNMYTSTLSAMAASADVSVTVTDSVSSILGNAANTYNIQVSNGGVVPVSTNLVHSRSTTGSATATLGALTCGVKSASAVCSGTTATIPAGGYVRYTAIVTAGAGLGNITYSATASITSGSSDPNLANNSASDTNAVTGGTIDIGITSTIPPATTIIPGAVPCGVSKVMTITATRGAGTYAGTANFNVSWSVSPTAPNTATITSVTCTATSGTCTNTGVVTGLGTSGTVVYTLYVTPTCPNTATATAPITLTGTLSGFNITDSNAANNASTATAGTRPAYWAKNCGINGLTGDTSINDAFASELMTRWLTTACTSRQVYNLDSTGKPVSSNTTRCLIGSGNPIKALPNIDIGAACLTPSGGLAGEGFYGGATPRSNGHVRRKLSTGTYFFSRDNMRDMDSVVVTKGSFKAKNTTETFSMCTNPNSLGPHTYYTYWQEVSTAPNCSATGSYTLNKWPL